MKKNKNSPHELICGLIMSRSIPFTPMAMRPTGFSEKKESLQDKMLTI